MFVLYPQASRAIKKVVRCEPGLPFKGGSLEPGAWSLEPLWDTNEQGRSVVSQERDPAISWQIPKRAGKVCCGFAGREEEMGGQGALLV